MRDVVTSFEPSAAVVIIAAMVTPALLLVGGALSPLDKVTP
jgi:hypothetical protein